MLSEYWSLLMRGDSVIIHWNPLQICGLQVQLVNSLYCQSTVRSLCQSLYLCHHEHHCHSEQKCLSLPINAQQSAILTLYL